MSKVLLPAKQLIDQAFDLFRSRYRSAMPFIIIPVVTSFIAGLAIKNTITSLFLALILMLIITLVNIYAFLGTIIAYSSDEPKSFKEYNQLTFQKLSSYLWVSSISGILTLGGFVLLLIPGLLFTVWFSMAGYANVIENKKGVIALARSRELVRHRFWPVAGRIVIVALLALICIAPFMIVGQLTKIAFIGIAKNIWTILFIVPLSLAYMVSLYRNLAETSTVEFVYDKKAFRKNIIAGIIGLILIPVVLFTFIYIALHSLFGR